MVLVDSVAVEPSVGPSTDDYNIIPNENLEPPRVLAFIAKNLSIKNWRISNILISRTNDSLGANEIYLHFFLRPLKL